MIVARSSGFTVSASARYAAIDWLVSPSVPRFSRLVSEMSVSPGISANPMTVFNVGTWERTCLTLSAWALSEMKIVTAPESFRM